MRKLATVRKIDALTPIEGADKIEVATVGGWKVVCQKGLYQVGGVAIYCEIDSWMPAEGKSTLADTQREGVVFKEVNNGMTFKVISNAYLCNQRD